MRIEDLSPIPQTALSSSHPQLNATKLKAQVLVADMGVQKGMQEGTWTSHHSGLHLGTPYCWLFSCTKRCHTVKLGEASE